MKDRLITEIEQAMLVTHGGVMHVILFIVKGET